MKSKIVLVLILCATAISLNAQTAAKHDRKKNLVVKEWNTRAGSTSPVLDHVTTYDTLGRKIEEIEYASYGQKERIVYEYKGASRKVSRQIIYNDKNKVTRIKKFEYNADGQKTKQFNYKSSGKLETTKTFEYSYK